MQKIFYAEIRTEMDLIVIVTMLQPDSANTFTSEIQSVSKLVFIYLMFLINVFWMHSDKTHTTETFRKESLRVGQIEAIQYAGSVLCIAKLPTF